MTPLSRASGHSVLYLAAEAARAALDEAGLRGADLDGIVSYSMFNDSVFSEAVGSALGARELSYVMDFAQGGQSAAFMLMHAAMAVQSGLAESVLVFRALNGASGTRIGRLAFPFPGTEYRYPLGYTAYPQYMAMACRRYMIETGATEDDLGAAAVALRSWALMNDRATFQTALTLEEYFSSPYIASPYRVLDCCREIDGAAAVVVTSAERARDLRMPPAIIAGSAWRSHEFDLDMGSRLNADSSHNFAYHLRDELWGSAGLQPSDAQFAELYDCFTGVLLMNTEGLGLCAEGAAGDLFRTDALPGGRLPINTNGGLLSEGYLHGMNHICEATWQIQGVCGSRQVPNPSVGVVCSGGTGSGSAIVLTAAA